MFSLSRIIGTVPVGALQPTGIQVVGAFACPPGTGGVPVELRVTGPAGGPTTTFTATTSTGGTTGPVESVIFFVPAWAAAVCGQLVTFEVRGNCGGQWTAWQEFKGEIDCLSCPRRDLIHLIPDPNRCNLRSSLTSTPPDLEIKHPLRVAVDAMRWCATVGV